jgi:RNA polymerase sigma-70 factor, ECF subfamily
VGPLDRESGELGGRSEAAPPERNAHEPARAEEVFGAALTAARSGSKTALGAVFEECRNYLLLVANQELGPSIQAKVGASDLVQETLLQAQMILDRFEGTTRAEFVAWLKKILEFKLAQQSRAFATTEMRSVTRELPIGLVERDLIADERRPRAPSHESAVHHQEHALRLRAALEQLPPDYRAAIELRSLEQRPFAEVGAKIGRSAGAARMIWLRAVEKLEVLLRSSNDSSMQ